MDRNQFDALAKVLALPGTRRSTLGALLGAVLLGLAPEASAKRGTRRVQRKGRNARQGKVPRRVQALQTVCWRTGACIPSKGSNVSRCDLEDSTAFENLDCTRCNVSRANLRGINARGANFTRANLSGACLVDADFTGATFAGTTNLANAIFCRTTMPNGSINNSGCAHGTACCPTCTVPLGGTCDAGDLCCGLSVCQANTCVCPVEAIACESGQRLDPATCTCVPVGCVPETCASQNNACRSCSCIGEDVCACALVACANGPCDPETGCPACVPAECASQNNACRTCSCAGGGLCLCGIIACENGPCDPDTGCP
jgi:hypothetical protein